MKEQRFEKVYEFESIKTWFIATICVFILALITAIGLSFISPSMSFISIGWFIGWIILSRVIHINIHWRKKK